ncbi:uncharacterized protein LOC123557535 [Mercenaria mercenaria]|uniref:uncharacterized protein LOC123557535 n=1 Tax=Mercenaria mercenaria TaxID=6596 RepID=UPI00234E7070|nr:uncharacterized protein LOC123557535 [Mercenaria mercenaria]
MPNFYVSSKCFIGEVKLSSEDTVVVHKYKLGFERKHLMKVGDFCLHVKVKVEILAASSVEESLTGQTVPVIAISTQVKDKECSTLICYMIFVDLEKDQFIPLRKFEINFKNSFSKLSECASRSNLYLLDGPCVALCERSEVLMYYVPYGTNLEQFSFNIKSLKEGIHQCCSGSKLTIRYQNSLEIKRILDKYLLFVRLQLKSKCAEHGSEVKNIVRVLNFSGKHFSVLNSDQFFPSEYNECVTSINVIFLEQVDVELFNNELYLGTSEGFIVHVKNGNILHCNSISENCSVTCLKMGKHLEDGARILAGTEEAYSEITYELQVEMQYTGIIHALTGDFYQDGSLQYLLLKQDFSEGFCWVLTNLKGRVLSSEDGDTGDQKQAPGSSDTALKALKARLQREQILLHEEELQARRTADFISDMFTKQVSIAAGVSPVPASHQSNMMSLIVGAEDTKCEGELKTGSRPIVEVKDHWQRTYEDSWCIGVEVVCSSNRSTKIWLDVVQDEPHTNTLTMKSSCLTLSADRTGSHASMDQELSAGTSHVGNQGGDTFLVKRQKLTENTEKRVSNPAFPSKGLNNVNLQSVKDVVSINVGTVVCVLPVPVFGRTNSVTANLIVNWTHPEQSNVLKQQEAGSDEGEKSKGHSGRIYTLCCGNITLNSKDVLDARYELNFIVESDREDQEMDDFKELRNNLLAWQHIQTIHTLVVKGNPGILARLESLLTSPCGFVYNQHYDCYVTVVKALGAIQIQLEPQTSDDGRMVKVYTRNDKDLFLTIHHLYAHLPDHVVILPRENSSADMVRKCLPALQKEADFLSHGLQKLLDDHEAENASLDVDDDEDDSDIRKVGEKFKRRRERMLQKQNENLKGEKVKQFMEQYRTVQELTDLAVATGGDIIRDQKKCNS